MRLILKFALILIAAAAIASGGWAQSYIGELSSDRLLGRDTAGGGPVEQLGVTAPVGFDGAGNVELDGTTAQFNAALSDDDFATLTNSVTLTNKTLTSPAITTSPTAAGATWADLGTVTTIDINGGAIDGVTIGGSSPGAGSFTTLGATGTITGPSGTWDSGGVDIGASDSYAINGTNIIADSAGFATLSSIDALDVTTETTIEEAIDTLGNLTSIQSFTVSLADAGADAIFGWDDTAGQYENLTQPEVLAIIGTATTSQEGVLETATESEVHAGTATDKAVTPSELKPKLPLCFALSDETTDLTAGTAKLTFRWPFAFEISEVRASVNTAPTGSSIIVDINEGGTTLMTTNKLSIDAGEETSETAATAPGLTDTTLADDVEITFDIDQIGSTAAGKGLKVCVIGNET